VDGTGVMRAYSVGYTPATGIGIEGWAWSGRSTIAPSADP